jgi:hypothetical protein
MTVPWAYLHPRFQGQEPPGFPGRFTGTAAYQRADHPSPGPHLYRLTGDGLRFAIFYTKLRDRLLRPLLAADRAHITAITKRITHHRHSDQRNHQQRPNNAKRSLKLKTTQRSSDQGSLEADAETERPVIFVVVGGVPRSQMLQLGNKVRPDIRPMGQVRACLQIPYVD